jgi:hypothetical protein
MTERLPIEPFLNDRVFQIEIQIRIRIKFKNLNSTLPYPKPIPNPLTPIPSLLYLNNLIESEEKTKGMQEHRACINKVGVRRRKKTTRRTAITMDKTRNTPPKAPMQDRGNTTEATHKGTHRQDTLRRIPLVKY